MKLIIPTTSALGAEKFLCFSNAGRVMSPGETVSPLLFDALSSLKLGMIFCVYGNKHFARKKSIPQVSHTLELILKSYLYQINPILIYKDIDKKTTEDSLTVGFPEILIRLENLGAPVPDEHAKVI